MAANDNDGFLDNDLTVVSAVPDTEPAATRITFVIPGQTRTRETFISPPPGLLRCVVCKRLTQFAFTLDNWTRPVCADPCVVELIEEFLGTVLQAVYDNVTGRIKTGDDTETRPKQRR